MAEVLTFVIGLAIGALVMRKRKARERSADVVLGLSAEWARHVAEHAEAQKGSVVMTAPGAMLRIAAASPEITCASGADNTGVGWKGYGVRAQNDCKVI